MTIPDGAVPFFATAVVLLAGAASAFAVQRRTGEYALGKNAEHEKANPDDKLVLPPYLVPGELPKLTGWGADASQALAAAVTPPITGLLLVQHPGTLVAIGYCGAFAAAVVLFVVLLFMPPDRYAALCWKGVSALTAATVALNVVLGLVVTFS